MQLLFFGIALSLYYTLHSLLADNKIKAILIDGFIPKRYYRIGFNIIAILLSIVMYWYYGQIKTSCLFENSFVKYLGMAMFFTGLVVLVLAMKNYNLSEFIGTQYLKNGNQPVPEKLRISGLNNYVRHPLYFATLLLLWGAFLFVRTDKLLIVAIVSTLYLLVGTRLEEQKLIKEFGDDYRTYQQNVPM
ncbi:MAG TPA: DUF1295 domain-containing protein [Saprospiraceae bacterium]|nr:DUF1295 domain-containing protein [Saprospiraceae bacterium]